MCYVICYSIKFYFSRTLLDMVNLDFSKRVSVPIYTTIWIILAYTATGHFGSCIKKLMCVKAVYKL